MTFTWTHLGRVLCEKRLQYFLQSAAASLSYTGLNVYIEIGGFAFLGYFSNVAHVMSITLVQTEIS